MGIGDVNVAYDGTFGDLVATDDTLLSMDDSFDFAAASGTISPKELFNDSVPPSSSFTNLTTPSSTFLDTPEDEYQTSPLFGDTLGADAQGGVNSWFPLFPESDTDAFTAIQSSTAAMTRTISGSSIGQIMVHPGGESLRKRSSAKASPTVLSPVMKHSSVAGVTARKRDKPLPPILVDEDDPVAVKRARNTAAARKSREKKVLEKDALEAKIADLEAQVEHWKSLALGRASARDGSDT